MYATDLHFFVMNNLFCNDAKDVINEKYDLKGSWVARNAKVPQDGKQATCAYCNQNFQYYRDPAMKNRKRSRAISVKTERPSFVENPIPGRTFSFSGSAAQTQTQTQQSQTQQPQDDKKTGSSVKDAESFSQDK